MTNIGLAILTHNRPKVLERTLNSYKENNFFKIFDQKIILLQENLPEVRKVAEKFDLTIYSTEKNIGIGYGNNFLINKLNTDYFIICQDDFKLINSNINEINDGVNMIKEGLINCFRLRSLKTPGDPCYSCNRLPRPNGDLEKTHICSILYKNFIKEPHKDNRFKNIFKYNKYYDCYILSSKYANYTENPCIYKKDWYLKNLSKFNKIGGTLAENNIQSFWEVKNFKIGIKKGIFTHDDS